MTKESQSEFAKKYQAHIEAQNKRLQESWDKRRNEAIDQMHADNPNFSRVMCEMIFDEQLSEALAWQAILPSPH